MRLRAFTLVESMIVLVTIMLLAALLTPALVSAKESANRIACSSNFHQTSLGTMLYTGDYDDRLLPVAHVPTLDGNARTDKTWVQLSLPYVKAFSIFECPSDYSRDRTRIVFEPSAVPGDPYARFYEASKRSNLGYNWLYLSPVIRQGGRWASVPRYVSQAADTSRTIFLADSVYSVANGSPKGGGHYLIYPPCRYDLLNRSDSFRLGSGERDFFIPEVGWSRNVDDGDFGHVWAWHRKKVTLVMLDGSVRVQATSQLHAGCEYAPSWSGLINDPTGYAWDLR